MSTIKICVMSFFRVFWLTYSNLSMHWGTHHPKEVTPKGFLQETAGGDDYSYLVGGWATPLKNMSSSVGMMTFPIYGKIIHSCSKPPTRYVLLSLVVSEAAWNPAVGFVPQLDDFLHTQCDVNGWILKFGVHDAFLQTQVHCSTIRWLGNYW